MRTSTITPPFPKYPKIMIVMHWITLAAVVIGVVAIYTRGLVEGRALRSGLLDLHRSCELVVLVTVTLRMAFYFYARRRVQHDLPASLKFIGGINHLALYLLMFTLPIIGWVQSNARGQTVEFFGLALPTLMSRDRDLADVLGTYHQWTAWIFFVLIFAHAAAALWHHFLRRDTVLPSMLPLTKPRRDILAPVMRSIEQTTTLSEHLSSPQSPSVSMK